MINAREKARIRAVQGNGLRHRIHRGASRLAMAAALAAAAASHAYAQHIVLTPGDDVFILTDVTPPFTSIDALDGFDIFRVERSDDFTLSLGSLLNFDLFQLAGPGTLFVQGDGSDQVWLLEGGAFNIETGSSIGRLAFTGGPARAENNGVIGNIMVASGVGFNANDIVLTNAGSIFGVRAVDGSGDGFQLLNQEGGVIQGGNRAVSVTGDNAVITNDGVMLARGGVFESTLSVQGAGATVINRGAIGAGLDPVTGPGVNNARAVSLDAGLAGGITRFTNFGEVRAFGQGAQGVGISGGVSILDLRESGLIEVEGENAIGLRVSAVTGMGVAPPPILTIITNAGWIAANDEGGIGVAIFGVEGQRSQLINTGQITGGRFGILGGDGDDTVRISGAVFGGEAAISLGGGNDIVILEDGAVIGDLSGRGGVIDGGDGENAFVVDIAGEMSLDAGLIRNFTFHSMIGTGALTLSGDGSGQVWGNSQGMLVIGQDGAIERISGGQGQVVNYGTILAELASGPTDAAVFLGNGVQSDARFDNYGAVLGQVRLFGNELAAHNHLGGVINSRFNGATLIGADNHLTNDGFILTGGGAGVSGARLVGDSNTLLNTGFILAGWDGSGISPQEDATAVFMVGDLNNLINSGGLLAYGSGARGVQSEGSAWMRNLQGALILASGANAAAVSFEEGGLLNAGEIIAEGEDAHAIEVLSQTGQAVTITNADGGFIYGHGWGIVGGAGSHHITLQSGSALGGELGAIRLGDGDDQLDVHHGAMIYGLVDGGGGLDTLRFIGEGDPWLVSLDQFVNWELINVEGSVYFAGAGTFGLLVVAEGGMLGGTPTLNGDLLVDGTLAPGNSIGTMTVNGTVTFGNDSTLWMELAPNGLSDRLIVNGGLNLGGALEIDPLGAASAYSVRTRYSLLDVSGTVDGEFHSVTVSGQFETHFSMNNGLGELTLMRQVDFTASSGSANATAAAGALNASLRPDMEQGMVDVMDSVLLLDMAGRATALDDLSGDPYPTHLVGNLFAQRAFARRTGRSFRQGLMESGAWLDGGSDATRLGSEPGARSLTVKRSGVYAGYDWASGTRTAGLSFAYHDGDTSADHVSADTRSVGLGAHAAMQLDAFDLGVTASVMSHRSDMARGLRLGPAGAVANGRLDARGGHLGVAVARSFDAPDLGGAVIRPAMRLDYTHLKSDSFEESGAGAAALMVSSSNHDSIQASAGTAIIWGPSPGGEQGLRLALHGDVVLELGDRAAGMTARHAAGIQAFDIRSAQLAGDRVELGAELSGELGNGLRVSAAYDAHFGERVRDHRAMLSVGWRF